MDKTFDPTKPVRTRDGRSARILCSDMRSDYKTVVALILGLDGKETFQWYYSDGSFLFNHKDHQLDLVNYDPFEITDEEAELIIDLISAIPQNKQLIFSHGWEDRTRNREFFRGRLPQQFRDLIIKHRKSQ